MDRQGSPKGTHRDDMLTFHLLCRADSMTLKLVVDAVSVPPPNPQPPTKNVKFDCSSISSTYLYVESPANSPIEKHKSITQL